MYSNRLQQMKSCVAGRVHSIRLQKRTLAYFPDMEAHKRSRKVVLVCNKDGSPIRKACDTGSFDAKCQEEPVSISLLVLLGCITVLFLEGWADGLHGTCGVPMEKSNVIYLKLLTP